MGLSARHELPLVHLADLDKLIRANAPRGWIIERHKKSLDWGLESKWRIRTSYDGTTTLFVEVVTFAPKKFRVLVSLSQTGCGNISPARAFTWAEALRGLAAVGLAVEAEYGDGRIYNGMSRE